MSGFEILGAFGVAVQLVDCCNTISDLIDKIRDAPQFLAKGMSNIKEVKRIAEQVKANEALKNDHDIEQILRSMQDQTAEIEGILKKLSSTGTGRRLVQGFNQARTAMKWDRIEYLFGKLEGAKSNLILQIEIITVAVQHSHGENLKEIRSEVNKILKEIPGLRGSIVDEIKGIVAALTAAQASVTNATVKTTGLYFAIPYARNPRFTGRTTILDDLAGRISAKEQRVSIFGLGGAGKTNLILELALQLQEGERGDKDTSIFWLSGDTRAKFNADCKGVIGKLPISNASPHLDSKVVFKEWLESSCQTRWLLLVDNVDDEEVFFEKDGNGVLAPEALSRFLPVETNGTIIFTTRNKKIAIAFHPNPIHLTAMSSEDAMMMLQKHLKNQKDDPDKDEEHMKTLVDELECLPLAIAQAAAYMKSNTMDVKTYLDELNDDGDESKTYYLVKDGFEDSTRPPDSVNPVFRTWRLSLAKIEATDRTAAEYLFFMSCLGRQSIPEFLLPPTKPKYLSKEALGTLKAYSFISERPVDKLIDLHRLVHLVTREHIRLNGDLAKWTQKVVTRLGECVPKVEEQDMAMMVKLLPHVYEVAQRNQTPDDSLDIGMLYYHASYAFRLLWDLSKGGELALWDWETSKRKHGLDSEEAYLSAINYADIVYANQSMPGALKILRTSLEGLRKFRDPKDFDILWTRCIILYLDGIMSLDSTNKIELELDSVQEETETLFGADSLNAGKIMLHVAQVCHFKGNYKKAVELGRRGLDICMRLLGPRHGWTILSRMNLALSLPALGLSEEGQTLTQQNMDISRGILGGATNSMLLLTASQAAFHLYKQGEVASGRILLDKTLEEFRKQENSTSVSQGAARYLAECLAADERFTEAAELYVDNLAHSEQSLGYNHQSTLWIVLSAAFVYSKAKNHDIAITMAERVVKAIEAQPDEMTKNELFLPIVGVLTTVYEDTGDAAELLKLREWVDEVYQREGPTTEKAALVRKGLGNFYETIGNLEGAEKAFREAAQLARVNLGVTHDKYLEISRRYWIFLSDQDRLAEAEESRRQVLQELENTPLATDAKIIPPLRGYAFSILLQEKTKGAEEALNRAYVVAEAVDLANSDPKDMLWLERTRAHLLFDLGRQNEALDLYEKLIKSYGETVGAEDDDLVVTQLNYAYHLAMHGRAEEAEPILREVLSIRERKLDPDHTKIRLVRSHLATALRLQKKFDEAEPLAVAFLAYGEKSSPQKLTTMKASFRLGDLYRDMGRLDEAAVYMDKACNGVLTILGPDSPITIRYQKEREKLEVQRQGSLSLTSA